MASLKPATNSGNRSSLKDLFAVDMLWIAWLPVIIIGAFHYAITPHQHWVHDVLRRLYYFPILFAAFSRGIRGGFSVAWVCSLTYAPHAFFVMEQSQDPGTTLNKFLEIVLYNAIGIIAGILADREARRRRQAEHAFCEQQRMATQLIRAGRLSALGELVAGIAHEIKNPLHTIKGTAEIVDDIIPKESEQASMWSLHKQEIDRLVRIADRFLSFARPSEPNLQSYAFMDIYQRMGELIQAQLYSTEVTLNISTPAAGLDDTVLLVDRDQLAQVALNITSNAVKAMGGKGTLCISGETRTEEEASWISFRIENDGPTIPMNDVENIFNPFFTSYSDGTGLGLSLSYKIIEAHKGRILAENIGAETGVAFTLLLPEKTDQSV